MTGLRDYVRKNGFRSVLLGLSGGIDSAARRRHRLRRARRRERVRRVMPSNYSSEHSKADAADAGRAHRAAIPHRSRSRRWSTRFLGDVELTGLAEENLQARVRGMMLMALSNQEGHLVLATGNKSELAVGYSTIYGDAVGGYAPIKDVPKTLVWRAGPLAQRRPPRRAARRRRSRRARSPSRRRAELRPGQLDTDSLPPLRAARRHPGRLRRAGPRLGAIWSPRASTPSWSSRSLRMVDRPSTSAGSTRRARRSRVKATSAATAGCRSPAPGENLRHRSPSSRRGSRPMRQRASRLRPGRGARTRRSSPPRPAVRARTRAAPMPGCRRAAARSARLPCRPTRPPPARGRNRARG